MATPSSFNVSLYASALVVLVSEPISQIEVRMKIKGRENIEIR